MLSWVGKYIPSRSCSSLSNVDAKFSKDRKFRKQNKTFPSIKLDMCEIARLQIFQNEYLQQANIYKVKKKMEAQYSALHWNVILRNCYFLHFFSPSGGDNLSSQVRTIHAQHLGRPGRWDTSSRQHYFVSAGHIYIYIYLSISIYLNGYYSGNDLYLPLLQYIWYFECKNISLSELMQLLCKYNFEAAKKWVVSSTDGSRGPRVRVSQFSCTWSPHHQYVLHHPMTL